MIEDNEDDLDREIEREEELDELRGIRAGLRMMIDNVTDLMMWTKPGTPESKELMRRFAELSKEFSQTQNPDEDIF